MQKRGLEEKVNEIVRFAQNNKTEIYRVTISERFQRAYI